MGSTSENGTVVEWIGELPSLIMMATEGMTRNSFKPGDQLTISAVPAISGPPHALLARVVTADGKVPIDWLGRRRQIPN